MGDTKILQAILNGQKALEERLVKEIDGVKIELADVKSEVKKNGNRIDKLGLQIARLEDDAPTWEDHDKLDKRITKIENNLQIQTA